MNRTTYILLLLYLILCSPDLVAQFSPITDDEFTDISSTIDYTKDTKRGIRLKKFERKPSEPKKEVAPFNIPWLNFGGGMLNLLSYLLIIVLIGVILYFLFKNLDLSDKSIDYADEPIFEEEDIEDIDAQAAYLKAVSEQDYRTAIRMRFILILQNLSNSNSIQWMPEKTNRDYLRELRGQKPFSFFQQTSNIYDRVWYGNIELNKKEFDALDPLFDIKPSLV